MCFAHVGGNWNNGVNDGFFYWNLNNDSGNSNANIGSRLLMGYKYLHFIFHNISVKNKPRTGGVSRYYRNIRRQSIRKMKRYNNIYESIITKENIRKALYMASKRKKKRKSVQKIFLNEEYYIQKIIDILESKTYKPSPYISQTIFDGARHKERTIYKPRFFPDQIIHWALILQIQEILSKRFYYYSCAFIKGKGTDLAIKATIKGEQSKSRYALKMDIKKFYPTVNKEIMKQKFRAIFKDKDLLWLIDTIIDGNKSQGEGLPIGNFTSQWFANLYLTDLDNFIKHELKIKHYIRYMDDLLIFGSNKRELKKVEEKIRLFLAKEKLEVKPSRIIDLRAQFIDFLGYRFYQDHLTLRRSNFLRIKRRAKKVYKKGALSFNDSCAMISYDGFIKRSNCHTYLMKYIYPYVSIKRCRKVVSNENRKQCEANRTFPVLFRPTEFCSAQ